MTHRSASINTERLINNALSGVSYFIDGWRLLWHRELRLFTLVPLLINLILFVVLTGLLINQFTTITDWADGWLAPLRWIALVIMGALLLIIYGYSFNVITNIIAAPFYGLLAERAEKILCAAGPEPESLLQLLPRVTLREMIKLWYFLTRGFLIILIVILIGTLPLIQFIAPALGLVWGAWCMSLQYVDYPADNHQLSFVLLRQKLWKRKYSSWGFGGMIMASSVVPIINIVAMPAAVAGGVIFWLNELKHCDTGTDTNNAGKAVEHRP